MNKRELLTIKKTNHQYHHFTFQEFYLIAIFSIFLGSQITEGVLLVPYWQSLSSPDFYRYYQNFGPSIGRFYTILTIIAAFIPLVLSFFYFRSKSPRLIFSLISSFFAISFVACFYIYFKGTNELFYQYALDEEGLKNELVIWSKWHWGRIILEVFSLIFLILAFKNKK